MSVVIIRKCNGFFLRLSLWFLSIPSIPVRIQLNCLGIQCFHVRGCSCGILQSPSYLPDVDCPGLWSLATLVFLVSGRLSEHLYDNKGVGMNTTIKDWFDSGRLIILGYEMFRDLYENEKTEKGKGKPSRDKHEEIRRRMLEEPGISNYSTRGSQDADYLHVVKPSDSRSGDMESIWEAIRL